MPLRPVTSLNIACRMAREEGLDPAPWLAQAGLNIHALSQPDHLVSTTQEILVLQQLAASVSDPAGIGTRLGQRYPLTSYGMLGYALMASATLAEAIHTGLAYRQLSYLLCDIHSARRGDAWQLTFHSPFKGTLDALVTARDLHATAYLGKELLGPDAPAFGLESPGTLVIPATLLDMPLPRADARTVQLCRQQCDRQLELQQPCLADQIRERLLTSDFDISMASMADHLACTPRTLHRQLERKGLTWQQLVRETRQTQAIRWLGQHLAIEVIAERLGYRHVSSFSHAFRRWTGVAPSVYLASRQASCASTNADADRLAATKRERSPCQ
jgi:AraC-like DNA-binding protein